MKLWNFVFLILLGCITRAQDLLPLVLPANSAVVGVDPFENLFVQKGQEILRTTSTGEIQFRYSKPTLGTPSTTCFSNPMAPVLFYQVFNTAVVLDNRLNAVGESINFWDYNLADARSASLADQNRMWVYVQEQDRMLLINLSTQQIEAQTPVITQLVGEENTPTHVLSTVPAVYLLIQGIGYMEFDAFGAYKRLTRITGANSLQIAHPFAALGTANGVVVINLSTGNQRLFPTAEPEHFALNEHFLYLQNGTQVVRFSLSK